MTDVPKTTRRVHVFGCQRYPHGAGLVYLIMADLTAAATAAVTRELMMMMF